MEVPSRQLREKELGIFPSCEPFETGQSVRQDKKSNQSFEEEEEEVKAGNVGQVVI